MFVSSFGSRAATTAASMEVVDRRRLDRTHRGPRCACAMGWSLGPPRSRGRPGRGFLAPRGMGAQRPGEESGDRPLRSWNRGGAQRRRPSVRHAKSRTHWARQADREDGTGDGHLTTATAGVPTMKRAFNLRYIPRDRCTGNGSERTSRFAKLSPPPEDADPGRPDHPELTVTTPSPHCQPRPRMRWRGTLAIPGRRIRTAVHMRRLRHEAGPW